MIKSNTDGKVKDCVKVLEEKLVKRRSPQSLDRGDIQPAAGGTARQTLGLNQGISTDKARGS